MQNNHPSCINVKRDVQRQHMAPHIAVSAHSFASCSACRASRIQWTSNISQPRYREP
jgi:hypothetical protein